MLPEIIDSLCSMEIILKDGSYFEIEENYKANLGLFLFRIIFKIKKTFLK